MQFSQPLEGINLINCAKANARQGIEAAAMQCGYGENITLFKKNLYQACQDIGLDVQQLSDLITEPQQINF